MIPKIFSGEVVETGIAYDETNQSAVRVQFNAGLGRLGVTQQAVVYPLDPYSYTVPLLGEHVLLFKTISAGATTSNTGASRIYYGSVIPARLSLLQNSVPGTIARAVTNNTRKSTSYAKNSGTPTRNIVEEPKLGETFTDSAKPQLPVQPFEGDYLIQGRYGQSIRLGSSFTGGGSVYDQLPQYKGPANSPIMILRTPPLVEKRKVYGVESLNDDAASIYLTSNQKIFGFKPAWPNLGINAGGPPNAYRAPQVIISSDRLIFNAKNDSVFLIGKNNVNIVTNKWAMQMDSFFSIMEEFLEVLTSSAKGAAQYQYITGTGPTSGAPGMVSKLEIMLRRLKVMKQ